MANFTITLQSVVNLASVHVELMPLVNVGGNALEPALSLCNDVIAEMCAEPSAWKPNRTEMAPFVTAIYRQDYQFGGATAFTLAAGGAGIALASAGTPGVSRTGTLVTVTTLEPHNFAIGDTVFMLGNVDSQFNSTFNQTPTSSSYTGGWTILSTPTTKSFTFTHAVSGATTSGAPGITNFNWLESATMSEVNSASPIPRVWQLEAVNDIHPTSVSSVPSKVCVIADNYDGTLKIRFQYVPGAVIFKVALVYQVLPTIKTALTGAGTGDWSPFPDKYAFVYRQFFLAHAYRYMNSPKAPDEFKKAMLALERALSSDDAEQSDQCVYPDRSILGSYGGYEGYDDF